MTQNTQRKNQDISCDVIHTTYLPSPVITIEGRKMVSHRLVAMLFGIDDVYLVKLFHAHAQMDGCAQDVYLDSTEDAVYVNGHALVGVMKVLPDEFDLNGMGFLALLLDGDPVMIEIQADYVREMSGAGARSVPQEVLS